MVDVFSIAVASMVAGLSSGPTTAGVLRGEKPRFQLFGDVRSDYAVISLVLTLLFHSRGFLASYLILTFLDC
jgi:hypothetical protein